MRRMPASSASLIGALFGVFVGQRVPLAHGSSGCPFARCIQRRGHRPGALELAKERVHLFLGDAPPEGSSSGDFRDRSPGNRGFELGQPYLVSLLLAGGLCLGFAVHAASLAQHRKQARYVYLTLLSLLQGAYCVVTYGYFRETASSAALPWGRAICVVTPFITYFFGQLVVDVSTVRRPWMVRFQRVNLLLTSGFVAVVLVDALLGTKFALTGEVFTEPESRHVHRLMFAPLGHAYLAWVSAAFLLFAILLARAYRVRRELLPAVVGCVVYFAATIHDFGILTGVYDSYFMQHLGYFALVAGFWRVLAGSYDRSVEELNRVIGKLEQQKAQLLQSPALLQEQKLSAMGTLAAGVAHEINNPVHGIQNYAQLLRRGLADGSREHGFAAEIIAECQRITEIVRALLSFARAGQTSLVGSVLVDELVLDALKLISRSLDDDGIKVVTRIDPELPHLDASAQELQQVIVNLLTNARDALNERANTRRDAKCIEIRARATHQDSERRIIIDVRDTGTGMEPAVMARIFDPFFTTKEPGKGTGLGLCISHGIVANHGGILRCVSESGRGSCFTVDVPAPTSDARRAG